MQMLQQKMLNSVPVADFVTTNPTHIAVALSIKRQYHSSEFNCKRVRTICKENNSGCKRHNIPVVENPPVARAIYRLVNVNKEIPPELYKAVAGELHVRI